ncbi:MAG: UDP-N-acetylmuramate dehydrogenase [Glaciecola sp.]|jgi:UDP-N-acetylmuramate dehydrogenase
MTIESVDSLIASISDLLQAGVGSEYLILGEGSNTVFVEDYPYSVLLNRIKGIAVSESESDYLLTVGAGENWHDLVVFCIQKGIGGFENLALIPGTVGASPIQNIGAYGVEIDKFIEKVEFLDSTSLALKTLSKAQCNFAYRDSVFKQQAKNHRIITRVFYRLPKQYKIETSYGPLAHLISPSAEDVFNEVVAIRKTKLPDPAILGNAGSFFKNPVIDNVHFKTLSSIYSDIPSYRVNEQQVKIPAAWLIDKLGYKGKRIGNIGCHVSQPLVLVNMGDGLGKDLLSLARDIRDCVQNKFAIRLENEVRLMGKQGLVAL